MKKRQILPHPTDPTAALVQLAHGRGYAIIDLADAEEVGKHNWHISKTKGKRTEYATTSWDKVAKRLHVFIWEDILAMKPVKQLDHIDRDGLNCRKLNLRPASQTQNEGNKAIQRNNTSGYRGVFWRANKSRWCARLRYKKPDGKRAIKLIGSFTNARAAAEAYNRKALEYFGEFAFQNPV